MNLTTKKVLAATAMATLMLPLAASAHGDGIKANIDSTSTGQVGSDHANAGLHLGFRVGLGHLFGNRGDDKNGNDNDRDDRATSTVASTVKDASTTSAVLTAKGTRLGQVADFMGSLSSNLSAQIAKANLSATSSSAANAKLADYATSTASAKAQAQAAVTAADQINTANSTTTNSTLEAAAKTDLSAARQFLVTARQDLVAILHIVFGK